MPCKNFHWLSNHGVRATIPCSTNKVKGIHVQFFGTSLHTCNYILFLFSIYYEHFLKIIAVSVRYEMITASLAII